MFFLQTALCLSLFTTVSAADQETLARISPTVWLYTNDDQYLQTRAFEQRFPKSQIPNWQRLQQQTDPRRMAYSDLCCLLAYYDVDYKANLRHILSTYWQYRRQPKEYYASFKGNAEGNTVDIKYVPGYLKLLYHKNHDSQTLGLLLDLQVGEGAPSESYTDALGWLWNQYPTAILHTAASSALRRHNIAQVLRPEDDHSSKYVRSVFRRLRQIQHSDDKPAAQSATAVTHLLKAYIKP